MSFYRSCLVYGCKVKATFYKVDGSPEVFGYIHMPDVGQWAGVSTPTKDFLMESPMNIKYCMLQTFQLQANTTPRRLSMYRSIKAMCSKQELEPEYFAGTRTSGPPNLVPCRVGFTYASVAQDVLIRAYVSIIYYCKLFQRNNMDVA